jgi:FMN-dependent oxidoreductase (nitrilotriacetate monooxygenase family)
MSTKKGQFKLGAFLMNTGHHVAAWRHPDAWAEHGLEFAHYKKVAQTAEQAKFDMAFLADGVAVRRDHNLDALSRSGQLVHFEPLTLLSALSAVTDHIGLVATASTTYNEPYHIARKFASLDYLSHGRAGWNVVTSASEAEAKNFNRDKHMEHALRYERAREFLQVVKGLWDSWDDDAFIRDKESGVYFEPDKLHVLNHKGKHFSVKGPLNVARPVQGYPVIVQAGASDDGQDFAAQTAEVIFTAQQTLEEAQTFYAGIKKQLAKYGRTPDQLKIMPGVFPVIGHTEKEAKEKYDQLQNLIHPSVGLALLSGNIGGFDLSSYPLDGPLPDLPETNLNKSRQKLVTDLARRENLTIRQLYQAIAGARGHWTIWGTPIQIADRLEEWFVNDAADGFNIMPPYLPGGLDDFVELVLPILRERGLFRTEYEGRTLRENLGLARPANQFSAAALSSASA